MTSIVDDVRCAMCIQEATSEARVSVPNPSREPATPRPAAASTDVALCLWRVDFASGDSWYQVGTFVAPDATSAIERAVAIFGEASAYRTAEASWGHASS
jgi:hypothetical protein